MPDRDWKNPAFDYRFGYQGQYAEKDEETGWNSFELRMYDAITVKWMTTDPYGEFWSPYLAMANNPNEVDPDGGCVGCLPVFLIDEISLSIKLTNSTVLSTVTITPFGGFWPGLSEHGKNVMFFLGGFSNAVITNHTLGYGRMNSNNEYVQNGQFVGDVTSVVMSYVEMGTGITATTAGTVFGVVTSPTGVGALGGGTVAVGGVALTVWGGTTFVTALENLKVSYHQFAQRGTNNGKLEPEELDKLRQQREDGTISKKDAQKLKRHEKNLGTRGSRKQKGGSKR